MTTSMRVKRYQVKQQPERWQTSGVMRATVQAQIPERKKKRKENDTANGNGWYKSGAKVRACRYILPWYSNDVHMQVCSTGV